jgi:tetratricopeptide (TPR) repeat protein
MKAKLLIFLLGLGLSFSVMAGTPVKKITPQDNGSKYGKDSVNCIMNLSLYTEYFRQWRQSHYKNDAVKYTIGPWYWVYKNCPRSSENIYVDGVKIIKYKIKNAPANKKKALIDTLLMIFENRIKYFPNNYRSHLPQEGYIKGREGIALYLVSPESYEKVYTLLKQSVEIQKAKSSAAVLAYYFREVAKMVRMGKLDTVAVVDAYDNVSNYLDATIKKYNVQNNSRKVTEYKNVKGYVELTFEPFAKCSDLTRIYQKKYNTAPTDTVLLKKIINILEIKRCYNEPLYFDANVSLYKASPSPQLAFLVGKMMLQRKRYKDALDYMGKCTTMKDTSNLVEADLLMAQTYRTLNDYSKARKMARKVIRLNPHSGIAYDFIGDLYAESAQKCGNNALTTKVTYWAAVDKYIQAKRVDPEMADAMNKKIAIYKAHFPTRETMFFYNIKPGDKYKVGCWINVTTTARASN